MKDWAVKRHVTSLAFKTGRKGGSGPGPGLLHNKELKPYLTARLEQLALTGGSIHVKQTSYDITSGLRSGDGVLCHALFGFPTEAILIKTETLRKTCQEDNYVFTKCHSLENSVSGN